MRSFMALLRRTTAATSGPAPQRPAGIDFRWLVRLRWWTVASQVALVIAMAELFSVPLPLVPALSLIGFGVFTNLALTLWWRKARAVAEWVLVAVMALDIVLLTGLLYVSGGSFNPFSFLYLVQIALGAVVLRRVLAWALAIFALSCYGALFLVPSEHQHHDMQLHLQGMWAAFALTASFIVGFVALVKRALGRREAELAAMRARQARDEKLAALGTLAAGAAHELATPLSTIAVAAKEMERGLAHTGSDAAEDARLIREQVERCRGILHQMSADAGEILGETSVPMPIEELLRVALADGALSVAVDPAARELRVLVPPRAFAQILRGLVKNAREASLSDDGVALRVRTQGKALELEVADRGAGMSPEVLARVGDPFFTTKEPGKGLGLGVFLARSLLERLGGSLRFESEPGRGTRVLLSLPVAGEGPS
jgi:two-component system sensor histidine kinase RegB